MHTDRCPEPQDGDQGEVDNETASDPVHLRSTVHYPNGYHSLLLIYSLLHCSCRFSSRYLYAHLHLTADGFRGRWWDYKSVATPSDYHHGDQLSTHYVTLKTQMSSLETKHTSCTMTLAQVYHLWVGGGLCARVCELWLAKAVMESLHWCEVLALFEVLSAVKMSAMI